MSQGGSIHVRVPLSSLWLAALGLALQDPAPLRVMSFNIRYDNPADGADAWPARRADVLAHLRTRAPDIVGLQEALRGQLDDFRAGLPGYAEIGVGRDDGRAGGEYAAILYRAERFVVLESSTFWFSDTPQVPGSRSWGNRVTRVATWARLRDRRSGRSFYVFNIHLDHESQPSRERSVAALLDSIRLRRHPGDPVLVTGDFNVGEDNPAARAMQPRFRDTFRDVHPGDSLAGTFNAFRGDTVGAKIDFVFADDRFETIEADIDRTRTRAGRNLSDHFPVTALVRFAAVTPSADDRMSGQERPAAGPELAGIVVTATRFERRVEDQPLRVEVVGPEEVQEKLAMTPGDVAMLLNETGGLRVQSSAPSLGAAGVRIHGLRGRYTQVLADGLPLHGEAGALGILQIPPMDLLQVEVLKGTASAMYGGAALGGLVNLVSRRPLVPLTEVLVNATSLGGSDAVLFAARPLGGSWRGTLLGGWHRQARADVDGDGWTDAAGYRRGVVRPRVVFDDGAGRTVFATMGLTLEDREGGTLPGRLAPNGVPFAEALRTRRLDAGVVARSRAGGGWVVTLRGSGMAAWHRHAIGDTVDVDRHLTGFAEATASRGGPRWSWLLGAALPVDAFRSDSVARFDYTHTAPALFAQADLALGRMALQGSARADRHSAYGTQLSPRLSALLRLASAWTLRISGGGGFSAPTPFVEAADVVGLRPLAIIGILRAERGTVVSADLGGLLGAVEVNATVFASRIEHPVAVTPAPSPGPGGGTPTLEVRNGAAPTRGAGADLVARYQREPLHVVASWTYQWTTEDVCGGLCRVEVPLNPRHSVGLVAAWEQEPWRVGAEFYVTGRQRLEDNPYRRVSPAYAIVGLLVQRDIGRARVFLNLENIGGTRMTRTHPLVRPSRSALSGWTTDAWGPLEGRTVNGGVRLTL